MRGAAQRIGVAVALHEVASRRCRLRLIDVELYGQFRIARLQRRMHQVAGEHGVILAAAEGEGDMAGRVARRRQDARVIADRVVAADDFSAFASTTGSTLSPNGGTGVFACVSVQ